MSGSDKERIKEERKFWGKMARRYDSWIKDAFSDQYEVNKSKLADYVVSEDEIVEIGCGPGEITFSLAPKCKKIIGTDISPDMISVANKKKSQSDFKNVIFQVEDAYNLSFSESSFDKVICVNALQVMKEPKRAIDECMRILKDKGEFLSITYCYGDSSFFETIKLEKWLFKYGKPKYWHNFKSEELTAIFKNAGFLVIEKKIIWKKPKVLFLRCRKTT